MVFTGELFADSTLHETRQGRENVDGRVYLPIVQLAVDKDLALGNVASQVRDRVSNIYRSKSVRS